MSRFLSFCIHIVRLKHKIKSLLLVVNRFCFAKGKCNEFDHAASGDCTRLNRAPRNQSNSIAQSTFPIRGQFWHQIAPSSCYFQSSARRLPISYKWTRRYRLSAGEYEPSFEQL